MTKLENIKSKTVWSALSLFFQSSYSAFLGLAANLVLTILLSPKIFGIYITLLSTISFLNYFSDIGLAASLIQKKDISEDDVKSTFTFQQILIIFLVAIGFIFGPAVKDFYHLPTDGLYLYNALLISFFISSLKTIPSIFLERKIKYQKIVLVQVIESTVFYLTVIIFALLGFGLKSFVYSVLLRAIIGLMVIYAISPWMPKLGISKKHLKQLLRFGVPFQASSFLALFKDDLIILFLGKVVGFEGVGYIGWAKKWAEAPIRIVMDNVTKVLFPVISRLQEDKNKVGQVIEKILYYQTALLTPLMLTAFFIMPKLVYLIPRYTKWVPALPLFYIFILSSFLVIYYSPFINVFNALGKVKISFSFMLTWTLIMWILTPLFTKFLGYYGFPLVHLIISLTFVLVVWVAKKNIPFQFFQPIKNFIISALPMALVLSAINFLAIPNLVLSIIASTLFGMLTYFIFIKYVFKIDPIREVKYLFDIE
jgi:O-antigen/teichoic acid export membrane protein